MRDLVWCGGLVATALVGIGRAAHAQSETDLAMRRRLIDQAVRAANAGDHAQALDLARRAAAIRGSTSLRVVLAEEAQATGDLALALSEAELCVHEAETDPTLPDRRVVVSRCGAVVAAVSPRVGRLTVRVPSPAPADLRVTIAGAALNPALYGVPYVVTPGTIAVEATAPGHVPFRLDVTVSAGDERELPVALTALAAPRTEPAPIARVAPATPALAPAAVRAPHAPRTNGALSAGPFVVLGAGAVGFGLSAVFFALTSDALREVDRLCNPPDSIGQQACHDTTAAQQAYGQGSTYNAATNVAIVGGALAVAGGTAWLLGELLRAPRPARAGASIAPVGGGMMVLVGGAL